MNCRTANPWLSRLAALVAGAAALLALAPAYADTPHHTLWAVKSAHNTVYLMGSVHVLKPSDNELPAEALDAYRHAGALVMEVDLSRQDTAALGEETLRQGTLPEGQTLPGVLGPDAYAKFAEHAQSVGLDPQQLGRFQPWLAAMTLMRLEYVHLGYEFESGVESQLVRQAGADHKPIIGLETMDEQLGMFSHLSLAQQRRLLLYTIDDVDDTPQMFDDIVSAWRRGDAVALNALLAKGFEEFPELYGPLTSDRNHRWMKVLTGLIGEQQDYLVVVGALHLVGKDGIIELLRRRGYRVEQL